MARRAGSCARGSRSSWARPGRRGGRCTRGAGHDATMHRQGQVPRQRSVVSGRANCRRRCSRTIAKWRRKAAASTCYDRKLRRQGPSSSPTSTIGHRQPARRVMRDPQRRKDDWAARQGPSWRRRRHARLPRMEARRASSRAGRCSQLSQTLLCSALSMGHTAATSPSEGTSGARPENPCTSRRTLGGRD